MNYTMEELVPIVGKLADKYTSCESTSITYEKADQLMEAVLYCIHELEKDGGDFAVSTDGMSAQQAYETGFGCVERKVKKALHLYNAVLPDFRPYENQCLYRSFVLELPHFFQRYDIRFAPQDTILILDYPVLKDISQYTGIVMETAGHGERSALEEILTSFVRKYCGGNVALLKYLLGDIQNIEARMI